MTAFSSRYDMALSFAAIAHRKQVRKGSDVPYIVHVVHVSTILLRHGFGEHVVVAGLLHDVVEDCGVPIETIEAEFGDQVAYLVAAVSEQKASDGVELPWEQRKADKLALLRNGGADVAALKAADALHNARTISADLQQLGPEVWQRFKGSPEQTLWYYREIATSVQHWLAPHPLVDEFVAAVDDLACQAGLAL